MDINHIQQMLCIRWMNQQCHHCRCDNGFYNFSHLIQKLLQYSCMITEVLNLEEVAVDFIELIIPILLNEEIAYLLIFPQKESIQRGLKSYIG
jgi:hypothetical protein